MYLNEFAQGLNAHDMAPSAELASLLQSAADLGLAAGDVGAAGARLRLARLARPTHESQVEMLTGTAEEQAAALVARLRADGVL